MNGAPAPWQFGPVPVVLLGSAALFALAGLRVLWLARHRAEDELTPLPLLGRVGVPTGLAVGLCLLAVAYHLLAYGLAGAVALPAIPRDRWVLLPAVCALVMGCAGASEWLERRAGDTG